MGRGNDYHAFLSSPPFHPIASPSTYMLEGRAFLFFFVKTARPLRGPLPASPTRTRAP